MDRAHPGILRKIFHFHALGLGVRNFSHVTKFTSAFLRLGGEKDAGSGDILGAEAERTVFQTERKQTCRWKSSIDNRI